MVEPQQTGPQTPNEMPVQVQPPAPPQNPPPDRDPSSIQIARIAGIPIRLHFTFLLLLVWFGFDSTSGGGQVWLRAALVAGIFVCVALHELGHALMGLRFGIKTSSITLYPIGGIARITQRPKPREELWIALAGPAVNFVIAGVLSAVLLATGGAARAAMTQFDASFWLRTIMQVNLMLALFNLIPAFPMDGGRVLRAILALAGMPVVRATNLSASIGQMLAIGFGLVAVFLPGGVNWIWLFIALFVYIGAGQEAQMVRQETAFIGVPVSKVMVTQIETMPPGASLREVADKLLHTTQQDFPIVMGDEVIGLITRDRLLRSLAAKGPDAYVAGNMIREFNRTEPGRDLSDILRAVTVAGQTVASALPLLVIEQGKLKGMVTSENLAEFFAIQQILGNRR